MFCFKDCLLSYDEDLRSSSNPLLPKLLSFFIANIFFNSKKCRCTGQDKVWAGPGPGLGSTASAANALQSFSNLKIL